MEKFNKTELFSLDSAGLITTQLMINVLNYYHPGHATLLIINPNIQQNSDEWKLANTIEILKEELNNDLVEVKQCEWLRSYEIYCDLRDELTNEEIFNLFFEYWKDGLFDPDPEDGWFIGDTKVIVYFKEVIRLTNLRTFTENEWLNKEIIND